jgi:lipase chaperone LimK
VHTQGSAPGFSRWGPLGAAALLAVVIAGGVALHGGQPSKAQREPTPPQLGASPASAPDVAAGSTPVQAPGGGQIRGFQPSVPPGSRAPLPEFMRGIPVDGELEFDADGHFRPTQAALHLFQHFFLAAGLEPDEVIRGRIALEIAKRLPPVAAEEAGAVLDHFVELRAQLDRIVGEEKDPQRRFERVRELRRKLLGPEVAEAFYGEDEQVLQAELELRAIREDPRLSEEERERRTESAEQELPPRVLAARRAVRAPLRVQHEVERMRAQGASAQEIFDLREREFGREAAERLAAFDAEQAHWQQALAAYRATRDQVWGDGSLAADEREARVEALRRTYFRERDWVRVRLLDQVDAAAASPAAAAIAPRATAP